MIDECEAARPLIHAIESIPENKDRYTLRELDSIVKRLVRHGALTRAEIDSIRAMPPRAKAYIAKSEDFKDFLIAIKLDEALGFAVLTRGQSRAIAWFLGPGRRTDPHIQGKGTDTPYIDVAPEGVDDGGPADGV
jgi:hypothetical protein